MRANIDEMVLLVSAFYEPLVPYIRVAKIAHTLDSRLPNKRLLDVGLPKDCPLNVGLLDNGLFNDDWLKDGLLDELVEDDTILSCRMPTSNLPSAFPLKERSPVALATLAYSYIQGAMVSDEDTIANGEPTQATARN